MPAWPILGLWARWTAPRTFLEDGGWKLFQFKSAEPVYRIVVERGLFRPGREDREIIVDGDGEIVKFGAVEDVRHK